MKWIIHSIIALLIVSSAYGDDSLGLLFKWPFTSGGIAVNPATGALISGYHEGFGGDVIFWGVGDTVSIIDPGKETDPGKRDMAVIETFRVETSTTIHGMRYDASPGSEILYIAAGLGGLIAYDVHDINAPLFKSRISNSNDNPGLRPEPGNVNSKTIRSIDAFGVQLYHGLAFIADNNFGVRAINAENPVALREYTLIEEEEDQEPEDLYISFRQCNSGSTCTTTGGYINIELQKFTYYTPVSSNGETTYEQNDKIFLFVIDYYYGVRVFDVTSLYTIPAVINFEAFGGPYNFTDFGGGAATVIENPQQIYNTSETVVRLQKFEGSANAGSTLALKGDIDFSAGSILSMMVWSPRQVPVTLSIGDSGIERTATHSGSGEWEKLSFNFSGDTGSGINTVSVMLDKGSMGDAENDSDSWTFYIDDISLETVTEEGSRVVCGDGSGLNDVLAPYPDPTVSDNIEIVQVAAYDMRTSLNYGKTNALLSDLMITDRVGDDNLLDLFVSGANTDFVNDNHTTTVPRFELDLSAIIENEESGRTTTGIITTPGNAGGLYIDDIYAIIADDNSGIQVVDMYSDAVEGKTVQYNIVGAFNPDDGRLSRTYACTRVDDYIFAAARKNGVHKILATDYEAMEYVSGVLLPLTVDAVYAKDDFAYMADSDGGFRVVDTTMPTYPLISGYYNDNAMDVSDFVVDNGIAFVANGLNGLRLLNVESPEEISLVGDMVLPGMGEAKGITLNETGSHAFIAAGDSGLGIIDIANRSLDGKMMYFADTQGDSNDVVVSDDYAYVADGPQGIAIVNISDEEIPVIEGTLEVPGASIVAIDTFSAINSDNETKIYTCALSDNGLYIIDVSTPSSPALLATWNDYSSGAPADIDISVIDGGIYAALAMGDGGITMLSLTNPADPSEVVSYDTDSNACDVYVKDGSVYSADKYGGIYSLYFDINNNNPEGINDNFDDDSGIDSYSCFIETLIKK